MEVKMNILDRGTVKISNMLFDLAFKIGDIVHRKYDPRRDYNCHTYDVKRGTIVLKNEEES